MADVLPAPAAEVGVGCGDVQALGADHEPVQTHKLQALRGHDVAEFAALAGRERGGIFSQRERGDLDAGVPCLADGAAGIGEGPAVEHLVADGVAQAVGHAAFIVLGGRAGLGREGEAARPGLGRGERDKAF